MSHGSITAAACGGSVGAIRMLLKCGALKNATDAYGKRALHTLQKSPIHSEKAPNIYTSTSRVLLECGSLKNVTDAYGQRALYTL